MSFMLRCDRCRRALDEQAEGPMLLIGTFRPSSPLNVPKTHPEEQRRRCRHCGFVNVFHPLRNPEAFDTL